MPRHNEVVGHPPPHNKHKEYSQMSISRTPSARKLRSDILWISLSAASVLTLWPGLYLYALATMPTK